MSEYILTVGLEIHAELKTRTKMFCNSKNDTSEKRPNVNICPVCLGYPGTLPTANKEALGNVLRLGLAVNGALAQYTEFDRKNYFYPDIPKGYQISQYKFPLVKGGELSGVALTRIHLEEDTAKSTHPLTTLGTSDQEFSLIDFNRAGVPLVELVTEPVINNAGLASRFAKEFQLLLIYLDIASANMERGEMRVEANVSVSNRLTIGDGQLGNKVEIKNLNSFKSVEKAINYEFKRQSALMESGGVVKQETRGWDEEKEETYTLRVKEDSHDYRYFPDPDVSKIYINEIEDFSRERLMASLPELPWQKRERYQNDYGLKDDDVEIYVREPRRGKFFEEVAQILKDRELIKLASNYITSVLKVEIPAKSLVEVIYMVSDGRLSSRGAKDVLKALEVEGGDVQEIADQKGLVQRSDQSELKVVAEEVIKDNSLAVAEYKKGKSSSLQFLIGQAIKKTNGSGNPKVLKEILEEMLNTESER